MSWREDDKREVKREVVDEVTELVRDIAENISYRERYFEAQNENTQVRKELELERSANHRPTDYEKQQWEDAKNDLKKLAAVKKQAYNEGYAAAYVDVTNRMKATPTPSNQGSY